jgi:flavorubredoxin
MKLDIIDDGIKVQYVPNEDDLDRCFDLGVKIAKTLKKRL